MQLSAAISNHFIQGIEVSGDHLAAFEILDDLWTDVRAAANGDGVSQNFRRLFDGIQHFALSRRGLFHQFSAHAREGIGTNKRARPGAKIFSAELFAHRFADVVVDVLARYVYKLTVAVLILEDFARRMPEKAAHNSGNVAILELLSLPNSRLTWEVELDYIAFNFHVLPAERGQAVTSVLAGVDLAARSHETGRKNSQYRRHHRFFPQARLSYLSCDHAAQLGQCFSEFDQSFELLGFAPPHVMRVIEILQTSRSIFADSLQGPARRRVDPNVSPGRRNFELLDAFEIGGAHSLVINCTVFEAALGRADTLYSRLL